MDVWFQNRYKDFQTDYKKLFSAQLRNELNNVVQIHLKIDNRKYG